MEAASRRDFLAAGAAVAVPAAVRAGDGQQPLPRAGLLTGKVAVVYGAGGAMGGSVSRAFAREGAHVVLAGRTLSKVEAVTREILAADGSAEAARVDALDGAAVSAHLDALVERRGRLDISFNLISISDLQGIDLVDMNVETFTKPIERAVRTHYLTATSAARHMRARASGVILMLTAQVARKPSPASGGFGVACASVEALCRQLAVELGPAGIRVLTLRSAGSPDAPGVRDAIAEHAKAQGVSFDALMASFGRNSMLRRMPAMAEVANAAVLMASDRASAITAAVTNVTCGEIAD